MKTKILLLFMLVTFISYGQKSPRQQAEGKIGDATISIDYSSPRAKGRTIYGGMEAYDKVWRAGADTNTTIEFSSAVTINGNDLAAGKYGFFVIPTEDGNWTAIFNKTNDSWGAYSYVEADDALRVDVKAKDTKENVEELTYEVTDNAIKLAWGDKYFVMKLGKE